MPTRPCYIDMQVHTTRYSRCSSVAPEVAIQQAMQRRLDGLVITEHDGLWTREELEALKRQCGAPRLVLIPALEVRTRVGDRYLGDLLLIGLRELPTRAMTPHEACHFVHRQGGLAIAPHPFAPHHGLGDEAYSLPLDALEVCNHRYDTPEARRGAADCRALLGIAAVAGSDAHAPRDVGRFCTAFSQPVRDAESLKQALRDLACRPLATPPASGLTRLWENLKG